MNASAAAASRIDKWYALGLLMVVGLFNYIDRLCMSILQVPIKQELNLSDTQLGVLTGLAFSLLYTTMAVPIARLTPNLRALASATNVLMAGTFGAAIGPFATGVFSDLIATNFALADDSLRYAIGLSSSFAAFGGLFFWRAAQRFPQELARNRGRNDALSGKHLSESRDISSEPIKPVLAPALSLPGD
jgi:MFS family permease